MNLDDLLAQSRPTERGSQRTISSHVTVVKRYNWSLVKTRSEFDSPLWLQGARSEFLPHP